MKTFPIFKVAATQLSPCYLDLKATVDKTCKIIKEAADNGAELIGFPETYLCGYPWWIFMGAPFPYGQKYYDRLYRNSFEIPGPEMAQISACARENKIFVCVSGTEYDNGSLYLTQVWFDDMGNLLGKHRKIRPTSAERTIWGDGDGSTMPVFKTRIGNLGGLQCWEHKMPANLLIMNAQNEQVHVASWPAGSGGDEHMFDGKYNLTASEYYASTVGSFVLLCSMVNTEEARDYLAEGDPQKAEAFAVGGGHSAIFSPKGARLTELLPPDREGILYADIDLSNIIECKYFIDCGGHYSKGNIASLIYRQNPQPAVQFVGEQSNAFTSFSDLSALDKED